MCEKVRLLDAKLIQRMPEQCPETLPFISLQLKLFTKVVICLFGFTKGEERKRDRI